MKKIKELHGFMIGMLTMALLMGILIPATAASTKKTISVTTGVPIYVDGVEMKPTDANGNPVETFLYNGTTYVPLRAISQYLGKAVKWDGDSRKVYIGKAPGAVQYLLDVCPPYQADSFWEVPVVNMAGKKYANCFDFGSRGGWALFNLDGQYNTLSFDVGHTDGRRMDDGNVTIYLDGEVAFSADLKGEMFVTHYDVPLHGALQMKIVASGNWYTFTNAEVK